MMKPGRIDVHHHMIPPAFTAVMDKYGRTKVAGAVLPKWAAAHSIKTMDANGIETALLSLSAPGVYFGDVHEACSLARACNEFGAELRTTYGKRFGFFAVLPMPFTEHACREACYALDSLAADGIVLLGSTEGVFLGDSRLEELMIELNRRRAIVFVHPNVHSTSDTLGLRAPEFFVEFLCDTTRAATNLIFSGTLDRFPEIRFILAHAGGFLPFIAWRLSLGNAIPKLARNMPKGVFQYIRQSFWFDTALSPSPYAMAALRELVDPRRILFGSDYPFAPASAVGVEVKSLAELTVFDDSSLAGIDRRHALNLFPFYASAEEPVELPGTSSRWRPVINALDWWRRR